MRDGLDGAAKLRSLERAVNGEVAKMSVFSHYRKNVRTHLSIPFYPVYTPSTSAHSQLQCQPFPTLLCKQTLSIPNVAFVRNRDDRIRVSSKRFTTLIDRILKALEGRCQDRDGIRTREGGRRLSERFERKRCWRGKRCFGESEERSFTVIPVTQAQTLINARTVDRMRVRTYLDSKPLPLPPT